ncbi:LamB/YcsF family protein [Paenibacillus sp. NEAU-GSW1]|uniref:LamB/YcsF family protein n=1 Tax=Paenibacillus sp. NEAU-GSW1 TaxID=2682486 RepID=UPI0012E27E46|nr:5-oxoprolinase subunit PxpA [Paenibacillus sp. NEAU-GSW1]MUT67125.1 5-oxoprolinase subunit PxpA [Paenibacillus sp. NEAU-GSW1]
MRAIDLNCDFGEGYGAYSFGQDDELLRYVTSVNIACGFHAGDPHTMREAIAKAAAASVSVGAHPGLPDRLGFGRREMAISPKEAYDFMLYQLGALDAFARAEGAKLRHMKPHGALYHMANRDLEIAEAIAEATCRFDANLIVFAQSGSLLLEAAKRYGLQAASEVFADRAYDESGSLLPRSRSGALIEDADAAARQAVAMAQRGVAFTADGKETKVQADTICLHGDGKHAASFAAHIQKALKAAGVQLESPAAGKRP